MSAFAVACRAMFRDRNMAADAQYLPGGLGPAYIVRVITARPDIVLDYQATRLRADSTLIDVQVSEVPDPRPGDAFVLDGVYLVIDGEPVRDDDRLTWRLSLLPEDAP